jgi:hypothetical protein
VIPGNAFLIGSAPASARIPNYVLPFDVSLSYREGEDIFTPVPQDPPFTAVARILGNFAVTVEAGSRGAGFGFRTNLIRRGVYGTILVDRINADVDVIAPIVEYCPDTTEAIDETSTSVDLTSVESCPPSSAVTADVSQSVLSNLVTDV